MSSMKKQRGATLLVALIMLLILTIAGLSAMENVNMQSKMARNSQFSIHAYQVALSEVNAQFQTLRTAVLGNDFSTLFDVYTNESAVFPSGMNPNNFNQAVSMDFISLGAAPARYNLVAAETGNKYSSFNYELRSVATIASTGTTSNQTQGLSFVGPGQ